MAYEFLKKLFGTTGEGEAPKTMTYEELEAALDADKEIQVVDLKAGGYVSKDKFDAKNTELAGVKQQLTDANTQIQSFKDQDVEGIKQKVDEWESKYNTDTQSLKDQLAAQERTHAEEMFLSGYQFTSKAARNGVLDELRGKNFQIENGTVLGGKEFMQSLMENEDYKGAFVTEKSKEEEGSAKPPIFAGGTGSGAQQDHGDTGKNLFDFGFNLLRKPSKE